MANAYVMHTDTLYFYIHIKVIVNLMYSFIKGLNVYVCVYTGKTMNVFT